MADETSWHIPALSEEFTCSSSCDDFFLVFFYACASQFYDAFSFYHKAYSQ